MTAMSGVCHEMSRGFFTIFCNGLGSQLKYWSNVPEKWHDYDAVIMNIATLLNDENIGVKIWDIVD